MSNKSPSLQSGLRVVLPSAARQVVVLCQALMDTGNFLAILATVLVCSLFAPFFAYAAQPSSSAVPASVAAAAPSVPVNGPISNKLSAAAMPAAGFADLAEKLLPAVVNISTTQKITAPQAGDLGGMLQESPFPPGSPFEDFFREFMERNGGGRNGDRNGTEGSKPRKRKATSLGSGFVIDASGYIVTNQHVIQGAEEITVILQDNTNLKAKLVGRDSKTDLALLKVESPKPLTAVAWGDSDSNRVGDWIIAIGNPFGLGGTVTAGIISARARDINSGPYDDYLQTDASINRGNSGGPMFNMNGEVIGVNTAIFSPSGGSIGIGFAIPSSLARSVIAQLRDHGHTRRGWLGVRIQMVTPDISKSLGLDKPRGALVSSTTPDGPADKAKVDVGDVIINFDGKEVNDMHRLPRLVAETEVGKVVSLTVFRKGKEITLRVKVGELEANDEAEENSRESDKSPQNNKPKDSTKIPELDMTVAPLSPSLAQRFELDVKTVSGVVVIGVAAEGVAEENGLRPGDVITEASQREVKDPADLQDIVRKSSASGDPKPLLLLIERKGELRFVAVKIAKEGKDKEKDKDKNKKDSEQSQNQESGDKSTAKDGNKEQSKENGK